MSIDRPKWYQYISDYLTDSATSSSVTDSSSSSTINEEVQKWETSKITEDEEADYAYKRSLDNEYKRLEKAIYNNVWKAQEDISEITTEFNKLKEDFKRHEDLIKKQEKELKEQSNKNFEILGIFSAIIALIIIDVNIIKSFDSMLQALLLIISLTCSLIIFASVIHSFMSSKDKISFGKSFYIPMGILGFLIILGIITNQKTKFNIHIPLAIEKAETPTETKAAERDPEATPTKTKATEGGPEATPTKTKATEGGPEATPTETRTIERDHDPPILSKEN